MLSPALTSGLSLPAPEDPRGQAWGNPGGKQPCFLSQGLSGCQSTGDMAGQGAGSEADEQTERCLLTFAEDGSGWGCGD